MTNEAIAKWSSEINRFFVAIVRAEYRVISDYLPTIEETIAALLALDLADFLALEDYLGMSAFE